MADEPKGSEGKASGTLQSKGLFAVAAVIVLLAIAFGSGYMLGSRQEGQSEGKGLIVIDDAGRKVVLSKTPERFVSLAPSVTEVLFAVGLGSKVVGVDDFSDYPVEAKNKTKVGAFTLNYEVIISLKPDLVVGADITSKSQISDIEKKGFAVLILAPKTIYGILQDIRLVGLVAGYVTAAMDFADSLDARIDAVTAKTSNASLYKPRVYLEYDSFMGYWTFGPGSFGDDLMFLAGGANIAHNATISYPQINDEYIIKSDPEVVVFTTASYINTTAEKIKQRPGWSVISAVKDDNIHPIDNNLIARSGPRMIDGLESLAKILHPDLFP
jgi:iron complex transport system substrate-binding protein